MSRTLCLLLIALLTVGCRPAADEPGIHLLDRVENRSPASFAFTFSRSGEGRRTLLVTAGANTEYTIRLGPGARLRFGLAMPFDVTDGALAEVLVGDRVVYTRLLDPGRRFEDRRWRDESVDLSEYAGQEIALSFRVAPGPRGDAAGDWVGWSAAQVSPAVWGK